MQNKTLNITSLLGAKNSFNRALNAAMKTEKTDELFEIFRAGLIQNFEMAYELSWKTMKRYIEIYHGEDEAADFLTRKDLFRKAAVIGLIGDPVKWFKFNEMRNRTVYTYAEDVAEEVYDMMGIFLEELNAFFDNLEKRISNES
jgi:nucleotidyltransferase substrate binding protein (TIGR01987 family)